ncbi:MAG: hypothetical protein U9Q98_03185 [Bacteroidota bacterium]|nr:hypothetical protein [Bacteroidota bacterium]
MKPGNKIIICILFLVAIALTTGNKIMAQGVAINEDGSDTDISVKRNR